jgi:hypothetical protein
MSNADVLDSRFRWALRRVAERGPSKFALCVLSIHHVLRRRGSERMC